MTFGLSLLPPLLAPGEVAGNLLLYKFSPEFYQQLTRCEPPFFSRLFLNSHQKKKLGQAQLSAAALASTPTQRPMRNTMRDFGMLFAVITRPPYRNFLLCFLDMSLSVHSLSDNPLSLSLISLRTPWDVAPCCTCFVFP